MARRGKKREVDQSTIRAPYIERKIGPLPVLSQEGLELIEANADRILAETGMEFHDDPEILQIFAEAGCDVDGTRVRFAPGFCVNCGGVVQGAEELVGADVERARATVERVFETTRSVLARAKSEGITPVRAAEREAEARIESVRGH